MSKKKIENRRNISSGKNPNPAAAISVAGTRRLAIPAIIVIAAIMMAVVIWLGSHHSGDTSVIESSVINQPTVEASASNQSSEAITGGPAIHFPEPSHDFATISQGAKVSHTFVVKNIGDAPLKLIRAKGS